MRFRYFVVDKHGQVRRAPRRLIDAAWVNYPLWKRRPSDPGKVRFVWDVLPRLTGGGPLFLVSVVCDGRGRVLRYWLLKVPLAKEGYIPAESRKLCVLAQYCIRRHQRSPVLEQMLGGWPANLYEQLAVLLDAPVAEWKDLFGGVGGPLVAATALKLPLETTYQEMSRQLRAERRKPNEDGG